MTTRLWIHSISLSMLLWLHSTSVKAETATPKPEPQPPAAPQSPPATPSQPPTVEAPPPVAPSQPSTAEAPPPVAPSQPPTAEAPPPVAPSQPPTVEAPPPVAPSQPSATVPVPGARPQQMEPLPPPPPPEDPKYIARGPWRGRFWLGLRLLVTGPVAGERPARATVVAVGGGLDLGWRVSNWLGLGTGISGQLHDSDTVPITSFYGDVLSRYYGDLFAWDVAFLRLFVPLQKRFQPFVDVGGGLTSYTRPTGGGLIGGHLRAGVGFEGWVSQNVTLGLSCYYRLTALEQRWKDDSPNYPLGHSLQGAMELGFHW